MNISFFKIVIAIFFDFFLGGYWFSKSGFAIQWMKETGISESKINEAIKSGNINMALTFFIQVVMNILGIVGQILLLGVLNPDNIFESIIYSFGIWLAFCAPGHMRCVLWEFKSFKYFLINSGYKFISMLFLAVAIFA